MSLNALRSVGFTFQNKSETLNPQKEKTRKRIVKCILAIYWLLIFEGALRKWAFPQYHQIIFFVRDPVALLVYFLALRNNIFNRDPFLSTGILISIAFIPLIFIQATFLNMNPFTLIYGWRMYFFYLPLAFVIKDAFNAEDIYKLIRQTLYIAIPLSALVYFQYLSPPDSFINIGYGAGKAFVVSGLIVRTTGTFTFTAGQTFFASSLMAMLIFVWLYHKRYPLLSLTWLIIATVASIATLLLTGSRTAFFMTGLIVATTFTGLFLTNDIKLKFTGTILLAFLLLIGTAMFLGPFKESLEALGTRFAQAEQSEGSVIGRAIAPLIIFTRYITATPVIGYGLGYGTGGGSLLATGKASLVLAEDEWSRVIMEAGPGFGIIYILYRMIFTLGLAKLAIKSARIENNLLPIIFLGFIGFILFNGQISHQGTIQGYTWIFVGMVMASAKKQIPATDENPARAKPLYPNILGNS